MSQQVGYEILLKRPMLFLFSKKSDQCYFCFEKTVISSKSKRHGCFLFAIWHHPLQRIKKTFLSLRVETAFLEPKFSVSFKKWQLFSFSRQQMLFCKTFWPTAISFFCKTFWPNTQLKMSLIFFAKHFCRQQMLFFAKHFCPTHN